MESGKYFQIDEAPLSIGSRWCDSFLVTYPASVRYNGGTIIDGVWYNGYEVAKPVAPEGFDLVGIGCGLQLNARPPYATAYLKPQVDRGKISKSEMQIILCD